MKKTLAIATIILLSGCAKSAADVAKYSDYQLCQHLDSALVLEEIQSRQDMRSFRPSNEQCQVVWNRAVEHSFTNQIINLNKAATPHAEINMSQNQY